MIDGRTVDAERDACLRANRGGFSFLLVHGVTWLVAAVLSGYLSVKTGALVYLFQGFIAFPASLVLERLLGLRTLSGKDSSLVNLFVLIAMSQGLALPASIVVFNLDPLYLPIVFASTNGGHFLAYAWLYRTRAYAVLAAVAALGPFALLVALGADAAFHLSGVLVGAALLATCGYVVWLTAPGRHGAEASREPAA
jgi:hypothetical protein